MPPFFDIILDFVLVVWWVILSRVRSGGRWCLNAFALLGFGVLILFS